MFFQLSIMRMVFPQWGIGNIIHFEILVPVEFVNYELFHRFSPNTHVVLMESHSRKTSGSRNISNECSTNSGLAPLEILELKINSGYSAS